MKSRLDQLLEMLREDESSSFLRFALAKEYEKIEDFERALLCYEQVVQRDPEYAGVYYHYAGLLMEMEQHEKGFQVYDKGIAICQKLGDHHALSELINARTNWELEL